MHKDRVISMASNNVDHIYLLNCCIQLFNIALQNDVEHLNRKLEIIYKSITLIICSASSLLVCFVIAMAAAVIIE